MRSIILSTLLLATAGAVAQEVTIAGKVISSDPERTLYDLMVVNKRTRVGAFGKVDGSFSVKALKSDTLIIGSAGHQSVFVCMTDSTPKEAYTVNVRLMQNVIRLREFQVVPKRDLEDIQKEISELGYKEEDYMLNGVNALESPITFLYQSFSKREESKRRVAELRNEDRKRALLKELLKRYVEYDIINLSNDSFDDFIDFCAVPDEVIKGLSQYDFLMHIKKKYELYSSLGPTRRH
ncbi:MAG: hypothetical protein IPJ76_13315 [Flavobacteriales bacterium]|nr:MAG: hypothetical protein IPJ76_13315 [Flavobacteriales bacterium]